MNDLKIFLQDRLEMIKGGDPEISNFLVQVYGAYYNDGAIKIIMELMDAGSLRDIMNMTKKCRSEAPYIEEYYLANIAYQVFKTSNDNLLDSFGIKFHTQEEKTNPQRYKAREYPCQ